MPWPFRSKPAPRRRKLAIVTATPPGFNPGMFVCDAMARSFVRRNGLEEQTRFFRIVPLEKRFAGAGDACYDLLESAAQLKEHVPLYWGDFLHMHVYARTVAGMFGGKEDGTAAALRLLLLDRAPTTLIQRSISFGTSILFNSTSDYLDPRYGPAFERFVSNLHHVQMRDAVSAAIVATFRPPGEGCFGIDAAQLLCQDSYRADLIGKVPASGRSKRALVFFGRGSHPLAPLRAFLQEMSQRLGLTPEWLCWGDRLAFPFVEASADQLSLATAASYESSSLAEIIGLIGSARMVITDTYHLSLIAWTLGVPAIMVPGQFFEGEKAAKQTDQVARNDKRRVFYGQGGLMSWFIEDTFLEEATNRTKIVERLCASIQNGDAARKHVELVRRQSRRSERSLLDAIHRVPEVS